MNQFTPLRRWYGDLNTDSHDRAMADPKDEIARLVQVAEEAAYWHGWDDACAAMKEAADSVRANPPNAGSQTHTHVGAAQTHTYIAGTTPHHGRTGGRPASAAVNVVVDCINASPGRKGVEVVQAVQMVNPNIPERTVRTALRRLKLQKKIWQRNGLWYPKPRLADLVEKFDGEVSSPHQ